MGESVTTKTFDENHCMRISGCFNYGSSADDPVKSQLRINIRCPYKFESRLNVDRSRSVVIERSALEKLRDPNNFPQLGTKRQVPYSLLRTVPETEKFAS